MWETVSRDELGRTDTKKKPSSLRDILDVGGKSKTGIRHVFLTG